MMQMTVRGVGVALTFLLTIINFVDGTGVHLIQLVPKAHPGEKRVRGGLGNESFSRFNPAMFFTLF